jgi:hypothetical protein
MNIGRSMRRIVRPLWVAVIGAALWSNRRQLLDAFQRWTQKAGSAGGSFAATDATTPAGRAVGWVTRRRPYGRTAGVGHDAGLTGTPVEPDQVGAIW